MDELLLMVGSPLAGVAIGFLSMSGSFHLLNPQNVALAPPVMNTVSSPQQVLPGQVNQTSTGTGFQGGGDAAQEVQVSLAERKAYVYKDGAVIKTYPIGIGRPDTPTPTGIFSVIEKEVNPVYQKTSGELIPPGPNNPLGSRWIGFLSDDKYDWGFHQGDLDSGSLGCVHMNQADLEELYDLVGLGTRVVVR